VKEHVNDLKKLWEDPAIQSLVKNHREQVNAPHISYFWEHVDRILEDDYKPTEEDILRVRVRTAGAYSTIIYVKPEYFEFFDVGGQKPERSKWERVLSSHKFSCILFFVACDEWDVRDEEREFECTKLEMSRIVFREISENQTIDKKAPIFLFLNRSDLFNARIKSDIGFESFKTTFPEYSGGQDPDEAMKFLHSKFMADIKRDHIEHYVTNALDKNSMCPVFEAVKKYIFSSSLDVSGV